MEVRFESMVFLWDDKIPTMFIEFVNLLTLATSEGQLRRSVKDFAEKHELDRFFLYGFGSHHFYLHQPRLRGLVELRIPLGLPGVILSRSTGAADSTAAAANFSG